MADNNTREVTNMPHVCVVGAGIAGLRCAALLIQARFRVTVLEARDRIGGRILQSNELGYPADMGPNWIYTNYGEDQCIVKLARETDTPLRLWSDELKLFDSNGNVVEAERAAELQDRVWDLFKDSFGYSTELGTQIPPSASLYQYVRRRIAQLDVSDDDRELLVHLSQLWGNYTGDAIQQQSLKYVWTEVICGGGDEYFVATSLKTMLDKAAEVPLAKADVQLKTKVVGLWSSPDDRHAGVEVLTDDGETRTFDEVVMAIPLGCLKAGKQVFHPPLTSGLTAAIDAISVGHLEKVYITFPKPFWRSAGGEKSRDLDHIIWLTPRYAQATNPFSWPIEAYDLSALESENSRPTLLIYTFGELSAHICALVHDNPDKAKQHALLDNFFKPYYSRMPHYSAENPDCAPSAFLASTWRYDELAGYGSYCNMQVGIDGADTHIRSLQDGMPSRGIWFAGEHAAPIEERGTVGGAWLSAEIAAEKIIAKHRQSSLQASVP